MFGGFVWKNFLFRPVAEFTADTLLPGRDGATGVKAEDPYPGTVSPRFITIAVIKEKLSSLRHTVYHAGKADFSPEGGN